MTDRELLELAAKAAGSEVAWDEYYGFHDKFTEVAWNPLTDDGDSARLESRLCMHVNWAPALERVRVGTDAHFADEPWGADRYAARRRAGVRAAAEIGSKK
jgi:hypothetical protein